MMMMKQGINLLLLLVSLLASNTFFVVEAQSAYTLGWDENPDTDSVSNQTKCKPKKLKQIYKTFDYALYKGGWSNETVLGTHWRFRDFIFFELDVLNYECSIGGTDITDVNMLELAKMLPDDRLTKLKKYMKRNIDEIEKMETEVAREKIIKWVVKELALANDFTLDHVTCAHVGDAGEEEERRNLYEEVNNNNPVEGEQQQQNQQNERELYSSCNDWCVILPQFYDCTGGYCRRRQRRNLRQLEEELDMQKAVDAMYDVCLKFDFECLDCAYARVCTKNDDGTDNCVKPSCHDLSKHPDGCWETGLRD